MTKRQPTNMAASVRARLLNLARENGRPFNEVAQHYALERWLYRLSCSAYADRLVLKGALLLRTWGIPAVRPTRDIDLLARASNDLDAIRQMIADICEAEVEADGMSYDPTAVATAGISEDADYRGVRATFSGELGTARYPMQIDLGFSDVVTPPPVEIEYPTLLDLPAPHLQAYNRETAIAEKFEAMVKLGELNSRMKDFYDIWALSNTGAFEGKALAAAIRATFERRGTAMDPTAICFTEEYAHQANKAVQWKAFVTRSALDGAPESFPAVWLAVMDFLRPVAEAARPHGSAAPEYWPTAGPWGAAGS